MQPSNDIVTKDTEWFNANNHSDMQEPNYIQ